MRISEEATHHLNLLKWRRALTPNILCRIAFCLSLRESGTPQENKDSQGQEFNRYTLTGEWDTFYMALLKMRLINDGQDLNQDLLTPFKEHIERGVILYTTESKRSKAYPTYYCRKKYRKISNLNLKRHLKNRGEV